MALAAAGRIEHDAELVFVVTMFHDQGIAATDGRCFTLRGAEDAEALLARAGWSAACREAAAEAITLHVNPAVPREQGAEAHLVHDGVLLDVTGARAWELRGEVIERVRRRHPRLRFSQEARRMLTGQARAVPLSRSAAALRCGFGLAVGFAPWRN